ncbi:hypothetical protein [Streptomyces flaveus]
MATATLIGVPFVCVFAVFQRIAAGGLTAGVPGADESCGHQ